MDIVKDAMAGTLESSDALVKVAPHEEGRREVVITSEVIRQFGAQIRKVAEQTLDQLGVTKGMVVIEDKGALDCVLKARIQAAVARGAQVTTMNWEVLK